MNLYTELRKKLFLNYFLSYQIKSFSTFLHLSTLCNKALETNEAYIEGDQDLTLMLQQPTAEPLIHNKHHFT